MPTPTLSSTTHALLSVMGKQVWIKAPVVAFLVRVGFHVAFKQSFKVLSNRDYKSSFPYLMGSVAVRAGALWDDIKLLEISKPD